MKPTDEAEALFRQGYSCSQAILAAFGDRYGLNRDTALKVASGFGGGLGRLGETCGAVTGAVMVLGLCHGSTRVDEKLAKETTYERVRELVARFKAQHGAVACRDLLGCDISTPAGFQQARERKLTTALCPEFVRHAAQILEELI